MQCRVKTLYTSKTILKTEQIFLLMLVVFNLILGLLIAPDYGPNWDEPSDAEYGRYALRAYNSESLDWDNYGKRKYYGPLYFMAQEWISMNIQADNPSLSALTINHYLNFVLFQVGILAFYSISRKIVARKTALLITFLFALQPLYFGHGFINGKDTPFLAIFLTAIALGLSAADRQHPAYRQDPGHLLPFLPNFFALLRSDWTRGSLRVKIAGMASLALVVLVALDLYGQQSIIISSVQQLIANAYNGQAWEPLNRLFASMAQRADDLPLLNYTTKAERFFLEFGPLILFILAIPFLTALYLVFDNARSLFLRKAVDLYRRSRHTRLLLLGAVLVGFATSIRVIGPFAGLLISVIYLIEYRARAIKPLIAYWLVIAITTYVTWPYLWGNPFGHLQESLAFMANHPWRGYVLYMGEVTKGNLLPWHFLPVLMLLQFTEPVWLLVMVAVWAYFSRSGATHLPVAIKVILPLWFLVPLIPMSFRDVWLYDNFRQFLFVTPVIFLYAAIGLDFIVKRVQRPAYQWLLAGILLLPGFIGILQLHPYQYVYYNSLAGGTRGASGKYELDYWCTSYYETTLQLNQSLPKNSVIAFWGTDWTGKTYARPDLVTVRIVEEQQIGEENPSIIALCSRANISETFFPSGQVVSTISIRGAHLTVLKAVAPDS